ncbi:MAG: hypothetical protein DMG21_11450 [Acidobacteria bacterium]|nr:MAG: hypothetical protein DMG21_11450 [Acidobacteriota bacterium]
MGRDMAEETYSASDAKKGEVSRRKALIKIGQAGAVAGLLGIPNEGTATRPVPSAEQTEAALPPGLYSASNDHLTHALGADGLFHPIPAGSETDFRQPRSGPFEPQFFAPEDFKIIARLVELMLGEPAGSAHLPDRAEGGPGSVAADVAAWVDFVAANSSGVREAARNLAPLHRALAIRYHGREALERMENTDVEALCREGLAWVDKASKEKFGQGFLALRESDQSTLLSAMSDNPSGADAPEPPRKFFRWLKNQAINGFYRSPAGLKELDFKGNAFYAASPGCSGHDHPGEGGTK